MLKNPDETFPIIEKKVQDGWMIIIGSMEFLSEMEYGVYAPGSGLNQYFELVTMGGTKGLYSFAVVKKIPELKKAFGDPNHFDKVIAVEHLDTTIAGHTTISVEFKGKKGGFKEFIRTQVFNFISVLGIYLETGERPISFFEPDEKFVDRFDPNKKKSKPKPKRNPISQSLRHEVFKRDDYKCVECGATKEDTRLHIDHILPVSQGGTDELSNLQTLCETCNLAKSNRKW